MTVAHLLIFVVMCSEKQKVGVIHLYLGCLPTLLNTQEVLDGNSLNVEQTFTYMLVGRGQRSRPLRDKFLMNLKDLLFSKCRASLQQHPYVFIDAGKEL